jgi:hypothetical protein
MRAKLLCLMLCLWVIAAQGQEYRPYPQARITPEEWQIYYDLVRANHSESAVVHPDHNLIVFNDTSQLMQLAFTLPDHPAHPAWVTRQTVGIDGTVSIQQIGYFAGDEAPFAELFRGYLELTERARLEDSARAKTVQYLTARAEDRWEDAYGVLSDDLRGYIPLPEWREELRAFYSASGEIKNLEIRRVTVYENPEDAPYPGIYLVTYFEVEYENLPIHCGNLVWFQGSDDPPVLLREEMGSIPADHLELLTEEQLVGLLRRMNCHIR